jgi:hypothetical protein
VSSAVMVVAAVMEKVQSDLGELKAQGASVAESLKTMTKTLYAEDKLSKILR